MTFFSTTIVVGIFIYSLYSIPSVDVSELPEEMQKTKINSISTEIDEVPDVDFSFHDSVTQNTSDTLILEISSDTTISDKNQ